MALRIISSNYLSPGTNGDYATREICDRSDSPGMIRSRTV
jgi:hypothetical protein